MSIESMIENYGYWALLIGTFFEGETIVILAGFLAHQGYLKLHWIILISFFGSLCGDQLFFSWAEKKERLFCPAGLSGKEKSIDFKKCIRIFIRLWYWVFVLCMDCGRFCHFFWGWATFKPDVLLLSISWAP